MKALVQVSQPDQRGMRAFENSIDDNLKTFSVCFTRSRAQLVSSYEKTKLKLKHMKKNLSFDRRYENSLNFESFDSKSTNTHTSREIEMRTHFTSKTIHFHDNFRKFEFWCLSTFIISDLITFHQVVVAFVRTNLQSNWHTRVDFVCWELF